MKIIGGESKSVTKEMTSSWSETTLPTILSNYKLEDIFNADEFGLFYQCLPDKTYHLKGEICSGGKKAKSDLLDWQQEVRGRVAWWLAASTRARSLVVRARSLVVSDLRSETKGSRFESGCQLCAEVSSLQ